MHFIIENYNCFAFDHWQILVCCEDIEEAAKGEACMQSAMNSMPKREGAAGEISLGPGSGLPTQALCRALHDAKPGTIGIPRPLGKGSWTVWCAAGAGAFGKAERGGRMHRWILSEKIGK